MTNNLQLVDNQELIQLIESKINKPLMTEKELNQKLDIFEKGSLKNRELVQELAFECVKLAMPIFVEDRDINGNPVLNEDGSPAMRDIGSQFKHATRLVMAVSKFMNKRSGSQLQMYFEKIAPFRWVKTKDKNTITDNYCFRKDSKREFNSETLYNAFVNKWFLIEGMTKKELEEAEKLIGYKKGLDGLAQIIARYKKILATNNFENPEIDIPIYTNLIKGFEDLQKTSVRNVISLKDRLGVDLEDSDKKAVA